MSCQKNISQCLCLESSGYKIEFDLDQNKLNLQESIVVLRNTVFRTACRYEYDSKELFMFIEDDQSSKKQNINPHVLPYPMDCDIIYGNIIFILSKSDFSEKDFQNFSDLNIFASPSLSSSFHTHFRSNTIRHIERAYSRLINRSDSDSSYRSSRSFESRTSYESNKENYKDSRTRCSSLSFGSSIDFSMDTYNP